MKLPRIFPLMVLLALAGCENVAAPFMVDGQEHAVTLIREQRYFWNSEVEQALVVSRLPRCQRRYPIAPGNTDSVNIEVFEAGDHLWAFHQAPRWYLVSTQKCIVQEWFDAPGSPPGPKLGAFTRRDGDLAFVAVGEGAATR